MSTLNIWDMKEFPSLLTAKRRISSVETNIQPYKYHPVDEAREEIRMITLHPGSFDSPIRVSLSIISFPKNAAEAVNVPEFEALSYAWGAHKTHKNIIVQSDDGIDTALSVTHNLVKALRYLRYLDQPRILWIDAIAVDQANMSERSSQVQRMADIYTRASRVVVWLGVARHDTALALEMIHLLNSKVKMDWMFWKLHNLTEEEHWADLTQALPSSVAENLSLLRFFKAAWFDRLWIIQEICLASPKSIVMVGHSCIQWDAIRHAMFAIWLKPAYVPSIGHQLQQRVSQITDTFTPTETFTVLELVRRTVSRQCTDPRDRIFALLSLCKRHSLPFDLVPDYTQSVGEVYKRATLECIRSENHLDSLDLCSVDRRLEGAPSWVPNLSKPDYRRPFWFVHAALGTFPAWKVISRDNTTSQSEVADVLETIGTRVGTVESVGVIGRYSRSGVSPAILKKLVTQFLPQDEFPTGSERFQAFGRVLMGNDFAESWHPSPPNDYHLKEAHVYETLLKIQQDQKLDMDNDENNLFLAERVFYYLRGRTIFLTKEGRLGLGPSGIQPGDIVTILLGKSKTACILRPKFDPELDATYEVFGGAYYDKYMDGEAFLGPIPLPWKPCWRLYERTGVWMTSYVNRNTREVTMDDPRRGELPDGWRREDNLEHAPWPRFVHEDGSVTWSTRDPRLFLERLRERGVNLETFRLV